jgi:hypothetical protein
MTVGQSRSSPVGGCSVARCGRSTAPECGGDKELQTLRLLHRFSPTQASSQAVDLSCSMVRAGLQRHGHTDVATVPHTSRSWMVQNQPTETSSTAPHGTIGQAQCSSDGAMERGDLRRTSC